MGKRITKKDVLKAIDDSGGIMTEVARRLGVAWATARSYVEKYPDALAAFDVEGEKVLDLAEETLLKSIKRGDTLNAKWILSRKGKSRGYVERIEQDLNPENRALQIGVKVVDYRHSITALAPGPVPDSDAPGENQNPDNGAQVGQDGTGRGADNDGAE